MTFSSIAPRIQQRIVLRRWQMRLASGATWVIGALVVALSAAWLGWLPDWFPLLALSCWFFTCGLIAWRSRPNEYEALAQWDKVAKRREAFAAAWWFERQSQPTLLQQLHLQNQLPLLPSALKHLPRDLPLGIKKAWGITLLLAVAPLVYQPGTGAPEPAFGEDATLATASEVARLAEKQQNITQLQGLTEQEKQALAALQKQMQATAADLKEKASQASARDVMGALDKNARALEDLSKRLGAELGDWASKAMIAELQRHTDTADLGDATANRKAEPAALAASALASQLRQSELPQSTLDRISTAFDDAESKAEQLDKTRIVGKPVLAAAEALSDDHADIAAGHLESLAQRMREIAQREATQKELQKLAQQLRNSASQRNNSPNDSGKGGMTQMQANAQNANTQTPTGQMPKMDQASPNAVRQAQSNLQPPGLGRSSQGTMQQGTMGNAQPGQQGSVSRSQGMRLQKAEGSQQGTQGRPRLIAPIPGKSGEQKPPETLLMMPNQPPPPGSEGVMVPLAGRDPGMGTAELNSTPTEQQKAGQSSVVNANAGTDGTSTTRSVQGKEVRDEAATRATSNDTLQQIQREESGLDDLALPPSRREHIRRYFQQLRKQFEKDNQ